MVAAGCPRCRGVVALHEGRPFVTPGGTVELWHRGCWDHRTEPSIVEASPVISIVAPRRRVPRWVFGAVVAGTLSGGLVRWTWAHASTGPATSLANVELRQAETIDLGCELATNELAPAPPVEMSLEDKFPIPLTRDGTSLDTTFTSLRGWVHPVTNSAELMPPRLSRLFGATRAGVERAECGKGHCGVDLDGPRGRPLVAVADGLVIRVERSELGADKRSGRYVRIQHDDGTLTAYMHMDDVAAGMQVGDRVLAGQYVGTLGATAVYVAAPHLHFSLEVPNRPGATGDVTDTHYVDPAPFLVRATIVAAPDRRPTIKPAS